MDEGETTDVTMGYERVQKLGGQRFHLRAEGAKKSLCGHVKGHMFPAIEGKPLCGSCERATRADHAG